MAEILLLGLLVILLVWSASRRDAVLTGGADNPR